MSFKRIATKAPLALVLTVLCSCRFLDDNAAPLTTLKINSEGGSSCPNLKESWQAMSGEAEKEGLSPEEVRDVLLCHVDAYEKKFKSVKIPRPEGLYPEEVAAIAREFFVSEKPLRSEEVTLGFFVKSLITRQSDLTLKHEEFEIIRDLLRIKGADLIRHAHRTDLDKFLELLFDRSDYVETISLRGEALVGASYLAERFAKGLNLSKLRARLPQLISALNPFLGYSSTQTKLPLGRLINALPRIIAATEKIDELNDVPDGLREAPFASYATFYLSQKTLLQNESAFLARTFIEATGFGKGAVLETSDWLRLFEAINRTEWSDDAGAQSFSFDLPTHQMALVFQKALASFSGRSEYSRLQADDIKNVVVEIAMADSLASLSWPVILKDDEIGKLSLIGYTPSQIESYRLSLPILRNVYGNWNDFDGSQVSKRSQLSSFLRVSFSMRLIQALHAGFDGDSDGLLDVSRDLDQNEFRELLKMADKVLLAATKALQDDASKEKSRTQSSDIESMLSSKKSSLVLSVFADNMTLLSKGDGAINAAELYMLVEELQGVQSIQSLQKRIVDKKMPRFASMYSLMAGSWNTTLEMRSLLLDSRFLQSVGNPNWDNEDASPACALIAFDAASTPLLVETEAKKACLNDNSYSSEDRMVETFQIFKPWLLEAKSILPPEKVLSNDETVISALLMTWVENVALVDRPIQCIPDGPKDIDTCIAPLSRAEFEAASSKHMGPSSLRLLPPRVRAPLLAANLSPEKILSRALYSAPEILALIRSRDLSNAALSDFLTKASSIDSKRLSYPQLVTHSWALAQAMIELGSLTKK
jgi:hypothetical protein